jgi:hypothetical protein
MSGKGGEMGMTQEKRTRWKPKYQELKAQHDKEVMVLWFVVAWGALAGVIVGALGMWWLG